MKLWPLCGPLCSRYYMVISVWGVVMLVGSYFSLSAFPFHLRGMFYVYDRFSTPAFYHFLEQVSSHTLATIVCF